MLRITPDDPAASWWQNARVRPQLFPQSGRALLLLLAILVSGCGSAGHTPAPSNVPSSPTSPSESASLLSATAAPAQADQETFAAIERQVEAIRGLRAGKTVTPVLLDPTGLRDKLTSINAAQTDHQAMADESRLYIHLGLLPAGSSLEQMELELDAGQVIGFYDLASKGLYVLSDSGGVGVLEKATFSHEYTHALQDQNFGLDKLAIDTADQGDRDLARVALPEGDATLAMSKWAAQNLSFTDLISLAVDPSSAAQGEQLAAAPAILRQTLLFPYNDGLAFVQGVYAEGGWDAVNKLYSKPPDSTSQILHPELYASGVEPVSLTLPAVPTALGSGWKLTMMDTMGELQLRIWLEGEHPADAEKSAAASGTASWGGDRVGLYEGPNGSWAVVMRTEWRTDVGVAAFRAAATSKAGDLPGSAVVCKDGNGVALYVGSDRATLAAFASC
jgi:hypothetical protein